MVRFVSLVSIYDIVVMVRFGSLVSIYDIVVMGQFGSLVNIYDIVVMVRFESLVRLMITPSSNNVISCSLSLFLQYHRRKRTPSKPLTSWTDPTNNDEPGIG